MKTGFNRNGFTVLEGLFVILVIAVLGFAGWFVWNKQQTKKTSTTAATTQPNASNSTQNSKNGTLYIKEWGVTLKYDNSKVTLQNAFNTGETSSAYITSLQLAKTFPGKCDLTGDPSTTNAGLINRGKPSDKDSTGLQTFQEDLDNTPKSASTLGDYVYIFIGTKQACTGESSNTNSILQNTQAAAKSIFN
jgi:Tfp pilus assembly protein PilV